MDPDQTAPFGAVWSGFILIAFKQAERGAQWLSGRVLDSRPRGGEFNPHRHHCVVSLSKNINPSLVLVQPRKTCPFITERLLMIFNNQMKQNQSGSNMQLTK